MNIQKVINSLRALPKEIFIEPLSNVVKVYKNMGYQIQTPDDIRNLPIDVKEKAAKRIAAKYQKLGVCAALASIPGGLAIIPGTALEIVGLSIISIRSVSAIALCYGLDPLDYEEDMIIAAGFATAGELSGVISANFAQEQALNFIVKQIVKAMVKKGPTTALVQSTKIVPFFGAGVSSIINFFTVKVLNINAMSNYRKLSDYVN